MSSKTSTPPVAKKPRASKPKVKSGCLTCKQRRVKCDETKPACLRCSNFGRVCGGYPSKEETPPPKDPSPPIKRKLLSKAMQPSPSPEPSYAAVFAPPPSIASTSSFPPQMPAGVVFQDEREYQYFCHFRDTTAVEFASGFEPTLFNPFVLRACDNPSIRQLVVATAALSIAVKTPPLRPWHPSNDHHHQYALQQYGQALKGIREMVAGGQDSTRIALISGLLIFCLESLHGDLGRAVTHVESAVDMINKRLSDLPQPHYFSRLGSRGTGTRPGVPIDNELIMAYMRLDRPSLTLMARHKGSPVVESNQIFSKLFSTEQLEIPGGFSTTAEARVCLEDIIWRLLPTNTPPREIPALWEEGGEAAYPDFQWIPYQLKQWYQLSDLPNVSKHLCYRLAQWHDAFSPLLNYAMSPVGDSLFLPAAIMHIQALSAELVITGFFPLSSTEPRSSSLSSARSSSFSDIHGYSGESSSSRAASLTVPDLSFARPRASSQRSSPTPSFVEMNLFPTVHACLQFSRQLTVHPRFSKGFVFEAGIIPSLSMISMMCPDRQLRKEAVEVLRSMAPRREGIWDSRVCAEAGDRLLATEDVYGGSELIDPLLLV